MSLSVWYTGPGSCFIDGFPPDVVDGLLELVVGDSGLVQLSVGGWDQIGGGDPPCPVGQVCLTWVQLKHLRPKSLGPPAGLSTCTITP